MSNINSVYKIFSGWTDEILKLSNIINTSKFVDENRLFLITFTIVSCFIIIAGTRETKQQFLGSIGIVVGLFLYKNYNDRFYENYITLFMLSFVSIFSYIILDTLLNQKYNNQKNQSRFKNLVIDSIPILMQFFATGLFYLIIINYQNFLLQN
jgi:hypothetical protein